MYDLDSLFTGRLSRCIGEDKSIQSLLLDAGVGDDLVEYIGALYQLLTRLIDVLHSLPLSGNLESLQDFLRNFENDRNPKQLARARVAVMTAISCYRDDVLSTVSETDIEGIIQDIEGRWKQILTTLGGRNIPRSARRCP